MGNKIYSICGSETKRESEINSLIDPINSYKTNEKKVEEVSARAAPKINLPFKILSELTDEEMQLLKDFDENIRQHGQWISQAEMTSYISENVKKVEMLIGPYQIPENKKAMIQGIFEAGPFIFRDRTVYSGQWNLKSKKHGYGIYIKPDGSKYEGFWNMDKIEGVGRYIDKNGNYYQGIQFFI